jgi:hypothetical protein
MNYVMILYFSEVMMCDENPCGKTAGNCGNRYGIAVNRTRRGT